MCDMEDTRYIYTHHVRSSTSTVSFTGLYDDMEGDIEGDGQNDVLENDRVYFDSDEVVHFRCRLQI